MKLREILDPILGSRSEIKEEKSDDVYRFVNVKIHCDSILCRKVIAEQENKEVAYDLAGKRIYHKSRKCLFLSNLIGRNIDYIKYCNARNLYLAGTLKQSKRK